MSTKLLAISRQLSARSRAVEPRPPHGRSRSSLLAPRSSRRGVLLMVVLAMLVLFMMIGTAFLMTSSQSRDSAKANARKDRLGNHATKSLYRALMKVVRDTDDPNSALRFQSLLRDLYGTDGFQAVSKSATYARQVADPPVDMNPLGSTQGQFIDIYVAPIIAPNDIAGTATIDESKSGLNLQHVIKLERDGLGRPQLHALPRTRGYYNGCLLTITSGPAAGQSTRIVDYQFVGDQNAIQQLFPTAANTNPPPAKNIWRFRVMTFGRTDGGSLTVAAATPPAPPALSELVGTTFLVNGRPFGGTGVGYNPLAAVGGPRLNAFEAMKFGALQPYYGEIALLPNSRYFFASDPNATSTTDLLGARYLDPSTGAYPPLNPKITSTMNTVQVSAAVAQWKYPTFAGPGGANEDYDAPDFQNMILTLQTVTPRARGRVIQSSSALPLSVDDPAVFSKAADFLRLDLEDVPLPSLHRPDLVNYWYHRLLRDLTSPPISMNPDDAVRAILQPYDASGNINPDASGLTADSAALISAIKRKIMMRPTREDHPHFDGSNSQSVPTNLSGVTPLTVGSNIAIPYWEVVGPWDVDNDNDGVPDSNWVDLGDPVQEAEDGTRYKAIYAILCIDLDSRLNVNAHGLADHINPADLALAIDPITNNPMPGNFNLAGTIDGTPGNTQFQYSTNQLAQGSGYGPAEISLRPVFPAPWLNVNGTAFDVGNRAEDSNGDGNINILGGGDRPVDSYATILAGRTKIGLEGVSGRLGYESPIVTWPFAAVAPGLNYEFDNTTAYDRVPEVVSQIKFFNYPINISFRTAFGTPPDLMGRYATGLDYSGQPVYEVLYDRNDNTPANPYPNRQLLNDSPYELDLSGRQRRDSWSADLPTAAAAWSQSVDHTPTGGLPGVNDDAPFATTDLERVLRAFDADAGTLPSRLWDVADSFDPLKLMQFDPYRVQNVSNAVFSSIGAPELMATAQQMAAINRRNVTTDSISLPVHGNGKPNYITELGPDGAPGVAGVDDDPDGTGTAQTTNGIVDDAVEIGALNTDDFQSILEKPLSQATLADIFYYRVFLELRKAYLRTNGLPDNSAVPPADIAIMKTTTAALASNQLAQSLLAPEVLSGLRMDLNRPFGDGRDNNANGVVDDSLEAGEPFLDLNGNGKRDDGSSAPQEPFIDLDGSSDYSQPTDRLWGDLWPVADSGNGTLGERIAFDYTNGQGVPVHPALGAPPTAQVRNLESQARQLYARNLYCLMLLLSDEGYIAPVDENDPQIKEYLDTSNNGSKVAKDVFAALAGNPNQAQEARRVLLRKLTCQMIAQWAVNCADMRDSDATMTVFEYDENPWDGWGCLDRNGVNIPLDGDPATDENGDVANNKTSVLDWTAIANNGQKATTTVPAPFSALFQTRGLVWGAERPELLITETLAFHDRRTEDTQEDWTKSYLSNSPDERPFTGGATSLDQRLRPRGGLFVEIYNPNPEEGQYPAELYSQLVRDPTNPAPVALQQSSGIELNRLSTLGVSTATGGLSNMIDPPNATATVKRSPVWRLAVVEENPRYRQLPNDDTFDNQTNNQGTRVHTGNPSANYIGGTGRFFEPADPDFVTFDPQFITNRTNNVPYVERSIYFTTGDSERYNSDGTNLKSMSLVKNPNDKLRLPPQIVVNNVPKSVNYFIAADVRNATVPNATVIPDVPIAPIKPGRYAVIGTAGAQYTGLESRQAQMLDANGNPQDVPVPRYVTTFSRILMTSGGGGAGVTPAFFTDDLQQKNLLDKTRRIELLPSVNPDVQQVFIAGNGGTPLFPLPGTGANEPVQRDNEIVKLPQGLPAPYPTAAADRFRNIFDANDDGNPDPLLVPPCVAIPVASMSASEPLDLYAKRATDLRSDEQTAYNSLPSNLRNQAKSPDNHDWNPLAAEGEGAYVKGPNPTDKRIPTPFNEPFDEADELKRNGTTRNYRTVHLQRLADPTLPWNPLPTLPDGSVNQQHDPKLPVNLYRTIDTASVDLTAYNGASSKEPDDPSTGVVSKYARYLPEQGGSQAQQFERTFGPLGRGANPAHRINFRSLERGWHATATTTAGELALVPRELWRQEPISRFANVAPDVPDATGQFKNDMAEWRVLTTPAERVTELSKRHNDLRSRNTTLINNDIDAIANGPDGDFSNFPQPDDTKVPLRPKKHHFDIVMKHSLGFQNETFGALTTRADLMQQGLPAAAAGTPMADSAFARSVPSTNPDVLATFPWLAWVNRPLVSAEELLQVPATSSSRMLRQYSTINSNVPAANQPNPYNGLGVTGSPFTGSAITVAARLALFQSPFGHLLNVFQTADFPAGTFPLGGAPLPGADGNWQFIGAPHFYRILEYVQVPSRFVGTDDMLTAEIFNDVPGVNDTLGTNITGPADPRYNFQPPFNKVSRERDPGKVNLNTVTGRRELSGGAPRIWSEVFDGIMHRDRDGNMSGQLGHLGPAWRDIVLSRRGYAQFDAAGTRVDKPTLPGIPDTLSAGLNANFPTMFANPFRSPDAGALVPLPQMVHYGIDASWLRRHHYNRGGRQTWGSDSVDDNNDGSTDDSREAGYGGDDLVYDPTPSPTGPIGTLLSTASATSSLSEVPLLSETFNAPYVDGERNPYFHYQPMTRLGNLVTNRSNVYAIWITVGYFEVEPAPSWSLPETQARFGGSEALYNRVYPDGYMLGKELGSDTGDVHRHRGFYIIDRSEPVGFKPGEDLNVEKMIRLRRRIE